MKNGRRNLNLIKIKRNISKKQLRQFGLLIGFFFPIVLGWLVPQLSGHHFRIWTLFIGFPSLIAGALRPNLLIYPYKGWMALGNFLGFINSKLILGLVFILVLLPIAFLLKLCGYDPLKRKKDSTITYKEIRKEKKIDLARIF